MRAGRAASGGHRCPAYAVRVDRPDPSDTPATHVRPRLAVLCALVAPVSLVLGWTWAAAAQPGSFDATEQTISALAAADAPHRWIMTGALVLTGAGHVVTALALSAARRAGRAVLAAGGLATLAVAAFPLPSRTGTGAAHAVAATAAFLLLGLWPWFASREGAGLGLRPVVARAAAAALTAASVLVLLQILLGVGGAGLTERVLAGSEATWPLVVAVTGWWAAGRPVGSPRVRHAIAGVGLVLAAVGGGVTATNLDPAIARTQYYEAAVSLSAGPTSLSRLHASTLFGDITVDFSGFAPGVDAQPRVRDSITTALAEPGLSVTDLQPSTADLDAAVRGAAADLLAHFAVGALVGALLVLALYVVVGRRRPGWRHLAGAVAVTLVASAGVGGAVGLTYRADRLRTFSASGLLGMVRQNANLLTDVEARANQTAPYVKNLLALSSALQRKYAPQDLDRATAARILLVSDIHGANWYPMMRQVVETEGVDAVIDSGDLVNFGTVEEARAAKLFAGIESLGVPYLFVRGNHDATSPTDTALLRRLAEVPNATVLDPGDEDYVEANVDGVRIAGFNDPRFFGDDNTDNAAKQAPARARFARTFAGDAPDVVVSHEPYAVEGVDFGQVRVNGHIHSDDLEGNRIGIGTFTGGGPFSHFIQGAAGEEQTGQPSAFDVLAFGTDCGVTTLTRYQFRDVVEGYPAYDDISLINGSTFAAPPPGGVTGRAGRAGGPDGGGAGDGSEPGAAGTGRTCSHTRGFSTRRVPAIPEPEPSPSSSTESPTGSAADSGPSRATGSPARGASAPPSRTSP